MCSTDRSLAVKFCNEFPRINPENPGEAVGETVIVIVIAIFIVIVIVIVIVIAIVMISVMIMPGEAVSEPDGQPIVVTADGVDRAGPGGEKRLNQKREKTEPDPKSHCNSLPSPDSHLGGETLFKRESTFGKKKTVKILGVTFLPDVALVST